MTDIAQRATREQRRAHLAALTSELTRRGFRADISETRTGVPLAHVTNPDAPALADTVMCAHDIDGNLALYWSWGKRISRAADTTTAAGEITRVLGT